MSRLRHRIRPLVRRPVLSAGVLICIALGVGSTTAILSLLHQVVLKPLPYENPDELVTVWETKREMESDLAPLSAETFIDLREHSTVFHATAAFSLSTSDLTGTVRPERVSGARVTPGFFSDVLGVRPARGRTFLADEEGAVAVLGYGFWNRSFAGDPEIIGGSIHLDGKPHTVVGVLAQNFDFENPEPSFLNAFDIWRPMAVERYRRYGRGSRFLRCIGRLKRDVTADEAQAELRPIAGHIAEQFPATNADYTLTVIPLHEKLVGHIARELWLLFAGVTLMLLVVCINLANALLLRTIERSREFAIYEALGARRYHIIKQVFLDGVILSVPGGILGFFVATWLRNLLIPLSPVDLPRIQSGHEISLTILFALLASIFTATACSLPAAVQAARAADSAELRQGQGTAGHFYATRFRSVLLVAGLAIAMALVASGSLLVKSFWKVTTEDLGFQSRGVMRVGAHLPIYRYQEPQRIIAFYQGVLERLSELPGVEEVGIAKDVPLGHETLIEMTTISPTGPITLEVAGRIVNSSYFRAMRISVIAGQIFSSTESQPEIKTLVVNKTLARQLWGDESPVGKDVVANWFGQEVTGKVAGVVEDVRHQRPDTPPSGAVYLNHRDLPYSGMDLIIRAKGDPLDLVPATRAIVADMDADLPLDPIERLDDIVARATSRRRFMTVLVGSYALVGLLLCAVGLYSTIAFSVSRQTREIGIRMAMGAGPATVSREILARAGVMILCGFCCGIAGAGAASVLFISLLYEVGPLDFQSFVTAGGIFAAIALLASYLPARRAVKMEPATALRYE